VKIRNFTTATLKVFSNLKLVFATLILSAGAFINGYPFLYSDSWIYISLGFSGQTVPDRSSLYSWFVRLASLNGHTLWTVIIAQNFLLAWVFLLFLESVARVRITWIQFAILLFLVGTTSLTWVQSQIMADGFTVTALLAGILLLWPLELSRNKKYLLAILFVFSVAVHISHLLLITLTILGLVIAKLLKVSMFRQASLQLLTCLTFLGWALLSATNFISSGNIKPAGSSQAFLLGRFYADRLLTRYVNEHCSEETNIFCPFQNDLRTVYDVKYFLWLPQSPLRRWKPGLDRNEAIRDRTEYKKVVLDVIRYYPWAVIAGSFRAFVEQLSSYEIGANLSSLTTGNHAIITLFQWFPSEANAFATSKQQRDDIDFSLLNAIQAVATPMFFAFLIYRNRKSKISLDEKMLSAGAILFFAVVGNALLCGCLSNPLDRYQARIIWIVPLIALSLIAKSFIPREELA
jgi:hypothetical protein